MFGKLLSLPLKLVNAPIRAIENLCGTEKESERVLSKPLDELAKEVEKIDEDGE